MNRLLLASHRALRFSLRLAAAAAIVAGVIWFQPEVVEPQAKVSSGLNLRTAPDRRAPRLAVLPVGSKVEIDSCLADRSWCRVRHGNQSGWASAQYLTTATSGGQVGLAKSSDSDLELRIEPAGPSGI